MPAPAMPLDLLSYDPGRACYRPYQRYSDERSAKGESLYRQGGQDDTSDEAIAARLGLPLGPAMVDKALSGFRGDNLLRGAISGYLQQVRERRVPQGDVIGLDEWSRLTRLPLDESSHLLTGIINAGVGIYVKRTGTLISRAVVNGHSGFMDLAMALMHLKLAHQESENKSRYNRITIAKRHADAEARGVIRSKLTPTWLEVTGGTFKDPGDKPRAIVVRTGPLNVVKRVFKEIRRHGIAQISEGLNRDWQAGEEWCAPFGLVTKRKNGSSGWHPASVSALLHDIRVMGLVQRTVTDQRTGKKRKEGAPYRHPLWPEIISPKEFEEAQEILRNRTKAAPVGERRIGIGGRRGEGAPNLLSGMARCAACGGPMTFYRSRPGQTGRGQRTKHVFNYLQCRSARIGSGCGMRIRFSYDNAEAKVGTLMHNMLFQKGALAPRADVTEAQRDVDRLAARLAFLSREYDAWMEEQNPAMKAAGKAKALAWAEERLLVDRDLAAARARLDAEQGAGREEHLLQVRRLWDTAVSGEPGEARTEARIRINAALRGVMDTVLFYGDGTMVLAAANGLVVARWQEGRPPQIGVTEGEMVRWIKPGMTGIPEAKPMPPGLLGFVTDLRTTARPARTQRLLDNVEWAATAREFARVSVEEQAARQAAEAERVEARRAKWAEKARRHRARKKAAA